MHLPLWRAAAVATALSLSGCGLHALQAPSVEEAPVELVGTPFFPQRVHHCGPAALATVLVDSGVQKATPDALSPRLFLPERAGTLRTELLATSRAHGRIPLIIEASFPALVDALEGGYPVLVLQNLGIEWIPRWHYAVVVAVEPERRSVVLRSGREPRRRMAADTFLKTWARSQQWGMVAARPDEIPAFASLQSWLRAAAPAESAGQLELALRAYQAARARWPESGLVHAALGNVRHALGEVSAARGHWRDALRYNPELEAARANLAATAPD